MQEEIRDKSVAFVIKTGKTGAKVTEALLLAAVRQYLQQAKEPTHGKQSVKSLVRQGAGVQNIEITGKNIKSFEGIARKYGVDYSLKKIPSEGKYLVFFKARDADALHAAFSEYAAKTLKRAPGKMSIAKQLSHFREVIRDMARSTAKNREKGGIEL